MKIPMSNQLFTGSLTEKWPQNGIIKFSSRHYSNEIINLIITKTVQMISKSLLGYS